MKKIIILLAILLAASFISAEETDNIKLFVGFGIGYSSAVDPDNISNNDYGVCDTPGFSADAGVNLYNWFDLYAGAKFNIFTDVQDAQQHYTFIPVAAGIRINIYPSMVIYPDVFFEYGKSISNRHTVSIDAATMKMSESDEFWTGDYYNFGMGINWKFTDITVLSLRLGRPSITGKNGGEYHIFSAGLAWKMLY